jgi:hypothetical protein
VIGWYPETATQCTSRPHFVHFGTYVSSSRSRSDLRGQTITTAILWAAHEQTTRLTGGDEIELLVVFEAGDAFYTPPGHVR